MGHQGEQRLKASPLRVERFVEQATGRHFAARFTRTADGAPYSKIELAVDQEIMSVTDLTWVQAGKAFRLTRHQTDRYASGRMAARMTTVERDRLGQESESWHSVAPSLDVTHIGASALVAPPELTPRFVVDCEDGDTWMERACWGYSGPGIGGGGGGGGGAGPCTWYMSAVVFYGVAATITMAALPVGALATLATGGVLAPATLALIAVWVAAEGAYLNAIADWSSCILTH